MTQPATPPSPLSQQTFAAIVQAFAGGLVKVWGSRAGQLTHQVLLLKFRTSPLPSSPVPPGWEEIFSELQAISYHELDSLRYVGDFGHLVFATTLFDTFLTDTTRFVFLLRPESIGKTQGITVAEILHAASKTELLRAAVEKRARELSYKSFAERIEFLGKNYGFAFDIASETAAELEHFSSLRNVMIHDQAFYDLSVNDSGDVTYAARSCPCHPRPITGAEIKGAIRAYERIVRSITREVFTHMLKVPVPEDLLRAHRVIEDAIGDKSQ